MSPQPPVVVVLVDATPPSEAVRALMISGKLTALAVNPGTNVATAVLVRPDDLARIDVHLAQWMLATAQRHAVLQQRHTQLTPREREALPLITEGMLNKQAASILGISEATLQIHRGRIMQKMAARSFADLVRIAGILGIAHGGSEGVA